jgi:hypothetical protein
MSLHVCLLLLVFFLIFSLVRLCHLSLSHQGPAQSVAVKRTPIHRLRHRRVPLTIAPSVASPPPSRRL